MRILIFFFLLISACIFNVDGMTKEELEKLGLYLLWDFLRFIVYEEDMNSMIENYDKSFDTDTK